LEDGWSGEGESFRVGIVGKVVLGMKVEYWYIEEWDGSLEDGLRRWLRIEKKPGGGLPHCSHLID
jgi:hypothetical protein